MTNKEEILITKNDVFKFIDEKPPTLRNRAILKDMIEDVAKQVAIEVYEELMGEAEILKKQSPGNRHTYNDALWDLKLIIEEKFELKDKEKLPTI